MATAGEKVQEAASAAADAAAEAAAEMLGKEEDEVLGGAEEAGSEGDQWSFLTRALVAVVVIVVCLFATRVSFEASAALIRREGGACAPDWVVASS